MDLDLLERARAGDRVAFDGLVATWGDRVARTAALLAGRHAAEPVARTVFVALWRDLPSLHSQRAFRPLLMRAVADAAAGFEPPVDGSPLRRALDALPIGLRTTVVLHLADGFSQTEIALVRGELLGKTAKALRDGMRALTTAAGAAGLPTKERALRAAMQDEVRGVELPPWFVEDALAGALGEPDGPEVRRLLSADPDAAWSVLRDPAAFAGWLDVEDIRLRGAVILEPGARLTTSGRIAGKRPSRDETMITRAGDDRVLGWTTRSQVRPWPSRIEFRWTLAVVADEHETELVHRLRGVAFPAGLAGRFLRAAYRRVAEDMPQMMHAGVERLAQAIETRARRPSL